MRAGRRDHENGRSRAYEQRHLLPYSRIYRDLLRNDGADVTYEEKPGAAHEWDFWDEQIRKTLDWLPLDRA